MLSSMPVDRQSEQQKYSQCRYTGIHQPINLPVYRHTNHNSDLDPFLNSALVQNSSARLPSPQVCFQNSSVGESDSFNDDSFSESGGHFTIKILSIRKSLKRIRSATLRKIFQCAGMPVDRHTKILFKNQFLPSKFRAEASVPVIRHTKNYSACTEAYSINSLKSF